MLDQAPVRVNPRTRRSQKYGGDPAQNAAVVTQRLAFEVEGERLIHDINLSLARETLTVVMGANGAGKSVLLRLLHGLLTPTAGTIEWDGEPMSDAVRKRQTMVFQRPVLLRRSTAANIDFVLGLSGERTAQRRDQLLSQVGLLDKSSQPARLLSGGEQQRLTLARALAARPQVLFLDEPTANLDPSSAVMIEDIVRGVHTQGTKVIFVTHNPAQAKRLGDEIVFLSRGALVEHASVEKFFNHPETPEARAFLDMQVVV